MTTQRNALVVTTPTDLEIVMTRSFDAPARLVFDAFTKPEHVVRWFGPRNWTVPVCEIDLRVGGRYRWVLAGPNGDGMIMTGEYMEIAPPFRLVNTEMMVDQDGKLFGDIPYGPATNTLVLEERDGKTTMTTVSVYESKAVRDGILQSGMEEGAGESFDRLAELLESLS